MSNGAKGQTLPHMLYCISSLHIQLYGNLATNRLIAQAINSISVIPPTTPYNPNALFSAAVNTHWQSDCCMGFRGGGVKGSELIDTVVIDRVTPWWTAHMAKESLSRYALAPWGMQPNTSYDESLVLYHLSSESTYYTIFCNSVVTGVCCESAATLGSCSLRSGKKSIFSAFASFAAVLNEKLTSRERTLVMYGRETFMRLASSV